MGLVEDDTLFFWRERSFKLQLVGGWTNPSEKYARQIGSFPQVIRDENKKNELPPPSFAWYTHLEINISLKLTASYPVKKWWLEDDPAS